MATELGTVVNSIILLFGGPVVIIVTAAIIGSYNQWRMRRTMEQVLAALQRQPLPVPVPPTVVPPRPVAAVTPSVIEERREFA